MINFTDWTKIEIKVGKILEAEEVEGSNKLLKLKVDFGLKEESEERDVRQVVSGIKKSYSPEDITNKKFIFITNLEPREIMGLKSEAMILAAHNKDNLPVLLAPDKEVSEGNLIG